MPLPAAGHYESVAHTLMSFSGHHLTINEIISTFGSNWPNRQLREIVSQMVSAGRVTVADAAGANVAAVDVFTTPATSVVTSLD